MSTSVGQGPSFDWQEPLRIGSLLRDTWRTVIERPATFFLVAIFCIVPGQVSNWIELPPLGDLTIDDLNTPRPLATLLSMVGSYVAYSALVQLSMRVLAKRQMTTGEAMDRGARSLLRVLWANLGYMLVVMGGMFLLIVPGIVALLVYMLAPAVAVVESKGMRASLRRSAELTRGHRVRMGSLFLLLTVVGVIPMLLLGGFAAQAPVAVLLLNSAYSLFATLFGAVLVANIYARLRAVHDGKAAYAAAFR